MATNMKRKKKAEVMEDDGSMTLTGHLKELRNRLIICAVVFVVGVVVSLAYADRLIDLLTAMGRDYYQFVSIAPQEKLMQYFRVSILAGVIVTFLSILELMKMGHIHVEQDGLFDDISVEVQTDPDTWKNLTEFAEDEP